LLHFLQPIWLYAIAGIIIPVLIHLWNVHPGKTLPVGSIALLRESGQRQSRRIRLTDWLLLLLRCLLITVLALLLAKPVWQQRPSGKEKGWVLMPPAGIAATYRHFQPLADSLLQAGYSFHYLQPGFPEAALNTALQQAPDSLGDTASYWALAAALKAQRPPNRALYLFTPAYLYRFRGPRPVIDTGLHWYAYTPADSVAAWSGISNATSNGAMRIRQLSSSPARTVYTWEERALSLPADTATTQIVIFSGSRLPDAHYLQAALHAIQQFTQRKIQVQLVRQATALPAKAHWLFWLSEKPVPPGIKAANTWQYDSGRVVNNAAVLLTGSTPPVALYKSIAPVAATDSVLWRNGAGQALLRLEKQAGRNIYHFSSRLDPEWTGLPWSPAFPGLLLQLLFTDTITVKDKRVLAAQQLQPDAAQQTAVKPAKAPPPLRKNLSLACWLLLLLLLLAERWWAMQIKRSAANA